MLVIGSYRNEFHFLNLLTTKEATQKKGWESQNDSITFAPKIIETTDAAQRLATKQHEIARAVLSDDGEIGGVFEVF
jgi:hypothetical protein